MTNTFKFTLLTAAAVFALGAVAANAKTMNNEAEVVSTTRVTTTTQTQEKTADIPGPQDSKEESLVWYESSNGGLLKVDKNFAKFDNNRNGSISSYEFNKNIDPSSPTTFASVDTDNNGQLTESEFNNIILEKVTITETTVTETEMTISEE